MLNIFGRVLISKRKYDILKRTSILYKEIQADNLRAHEAISSLRETIRLQRLKISGLTNEINRLLQFESKYKRDRDERGRFVKKEKMKNHE